MADSATPVVIAPATIGATCVNVENVRMHTPSILHTIMCLYFYIFSHVKLFQI
jgi:hypothetical protein